MSTWIEGRVYDYYGQLLRCVARRFEGPLELVDLAFVAAAPETPKVYTRTARALAPCVHPEVTETLGGVTRPETCHHDWYPTVMADAGPNKGPTCCSGCGASRAAGTEREGG